MHLCGAISRGLPPTQAPAFAALHFGKKSPLIPTPGARESFPAKHFCAFERKTAARGKSARKFDFYFCFLRRLLRRAVLHPSRLNAASGALFRLRLNTGFFRPVSASPQYGLFFALFRLRLNTGFFSPCFGFASIRAFFRPVSASPQYGLFFALFRLRLNTGFFSPCFGFASIRAFAF